MRRRCAPYPILALRALLLTVVVVSLAGVPAGATTPAKARRHQPTTFAVGVRTVTFVDTSRPTPANGTFAGDNKRTIVTLIYYPAAGRPSTIDIEHAKPVRNAGRFPL